MSIITHDWLVERNACVDLVAVFDQEFPDGAELNQVNLLRCATLELDLNWFAMWYFKDKPLDEYMRRIIPLWAEYKRPVAILLAEFERQKALLISSLITKEGG